MTTFQAAVFGAIHGFAEFLPISANANRNLVAYLLNWQAPGSVFVGALSLGAFLSILIYFRHDWASIVSCFVQVILFRRRPMTLDERLPFFILLATFPVAIAWYYFSGRLGQFHWTPLLTAATLAASGLLLWFFDSFSRKNKKMLDWTGGSAFFVGIFQLGALIPGCGRQTAALSASLLRNYSREAGARFAFFAAAPLLAASAYLHLRGVSLHLPEPALDLS